MERLKALQRKASNVSSKLNDEEISMEMADSVASN
jgi:hypothetical protein